MRLIPVNSVLLQFSDLMVLAHYTQTLAIKLVTQFITANEYVLNRYNINIKLQSLTIIPYTN